MSLFLDDRKVTVPELCKELGIDIKDVPYKKRQKEFEQNMPRNADGSPKRDRDSGRYLCTRKVTGSPAFSVYVKSIGYDVKVRYATTQRKVKDGDFEYQPKIIDMIPGEDGVAAIQDDQQFVFWFLHPWNLHSPFHELGAPHYFEYKDDEAQSRASNDHEENMINALGYIVGQHSKSIRELRALAKGLNFTGVDDMTDEVLKKALRDYARRDPVLFMNHIESRETVFSGMIQDAIDKEVLVTQSINGMVRWYLNGKEILPVTYGMDPLVALKSEMADKWHLYAKDVQEAIAGVDIKSKLNLPEKDEVFADSMPHEIQYKAELTDEQRRILAKMKEEAWYEEKIKKLAAIDPNDENVHHATRKSYEANKEAVEAYKAAIAKEPVLA